MRLPSFLASANKSANAASAWWTILGTGGIASSVMAWFASAVEPIARYGWGAVALSGILIASVLILVASAGLIAWRWFNPLPPSSALAAPETPELTISLDELETAARVTSDHVERLTAAVERLQAQETQNRERFSGIEDEIAAIKLGHSKLHDRIYETLRARQIRDDVSILMKRMSELSEYIESPLSVKFDEVDWSRWNRSCREWGKLAHRVAQLLEPYWPAFKEALSINHEGYRSENWQSDLSNFPNADTVHDYKTYRMKASQLDEANQQAFLELSFKERV